MPIVLPGVPRCPQGTQIPVTPPCPPPCPCVPARVTQVVVTNDPPVPFPQAINVQYNVPVAILLAGISPPTGVPTINPQTFSVVWPPGSLAGTAFQVTATATTPEGCVTNTFFGFGGPQP